MTNYTESKGRNAVECAILSNKEFSSLLCSDETIDDRRAKGQVLLDYLCDKFEIDRVPLVILDAPQKHKNTRVGTIASKTLGRYRFLAMGGSYCKTLCIEIYMLTAKTKQVVSINTFADTLLHEFMHHYDYHYLGLSNSIHSSGFFRRISDLKNKLIFRYERVL